MEQFERRIRILQAGTMTEHIKARRTVSHVVVGFRTKVSVRIEATRDEHFHQNRNYITMDAWKAINDGGHCRAILLPKSVSILAESCFGHERCAFFEIKLARL